MKGKRVLALLLTVLLLLSLCLSAAADFGDFSGDSDYGSFSDWDDDWDDDYGSSGRSSSGEATDDWVVMVLLAWLPGTWIVMFFCNHLKCYIRDKKGKSNGQTGGLQPIGTYTARDPGFSQEEMTKKLVQWYCRCQSAWQAKDMTPLRPYFTDVCYERFDRQLDAYRQNGQTNHVEKIRVTSVDLLGWTVQNGRDVIIARLSAVIVDYVTDDRTGNLVRGSRSDDKYMTYEWTLARTQGQRGEAGMTQTCPHCGAPVSVNHSARCEYCDSVLTADTFDWVISDMKGLSQKTIK